MQAEFEGHARAECFWARDVPGAKEPIGSERVRLEMPANLDRLQGLGAVMPAPAGGLRCCGGARSHAGLPECISYSRQRQPVGSVKFNA